MQRIKMADYLVLISMGTLECRVVECMSSSDTFTHTTTSKPRCACVLRVKIQQGIITVIALKCKTLGAKMQVACNYDSNTMSTSN